MLPQIDHFFTGNFFTFIISNRNDYAVLLKTFKQNKKINKMFEITAQTEARNGKVFVAGI